MVQQPDDAGGPTTLDHIIPGVVDDGGYRLRRRDLEFLSIAADDFDAWRHKRRILGISQREYDELLRALSAALVQDGVQSDRCDVRIQGSSARLFSGAHKQMPRGRDDVIDLFVEIRGRYPGEWEVERTMELFASWLSDEDRPNQRPFDSLFRLRIEKEPSDIDLQISSDHLGDSVVEFLESRGQQPSEARTTESSYGFIKKPLVDEVCAHLYLFRLRMADALQRHVSVAVFPGDGPPDLTIGGAAISSHFQSDDWVVHFESNRVSE